MDYDSSSRLSESSFNHINHSSRPKRNFSISHPDCISTQNQTIHHTSHLSHISTEAKILPYFQSSPSPMAPLPTGVGRQATPVVFSPLLLGEGPGVRVRASLYQKISASLLIIQITVPSYIKCITIDFHPLSTLHSPLSTLH